MNTQISILRINLKDFNFGKYGGDDTKQDSQNEF